MTGRFRTMNNRWDMPPNGAHMGDQATVFGQKANLSETKGKNPSKKGKYEEPEKGFFFVSEDGVQVLICGKGVDADDIQSMAGVISEAAVINLSYNAISTIPAGLPNKMIALDLSKNQLSHLYGLENVSNLRELYLGGNVIESTWGLTVATSLEILDLSANRIKLIEGLETLTNLRRLNLKFNFIKGMSAIRSLSFNKRLLVLDLSCNPVAERSDYKRNILHLVPSLEVLDDLKVGFDMFRKSNDYMTRYLNMKQFNETHDRNGFGFLWSGRPGRWDGLVFQAANSARLTEPELRALSDACAGSDMSGLYGTKHDAKKYPWRREPDIAPRPLHFKSAAEENEYRVKTPTKPFSPASSQRRTSTAKSPSSYIEMSQNENYLTAVLSQHLNRPEWNKYYRPTRIGAEGEIAKKNEVDNNKNTSKLIGRRAERASTAWVSENGDEAMSMGGTVSLSAGYNDFKRNEFEEYYGNENSRGSRDEIEPIYSDGDEIGQRGISPEDLQSTLLELFEHKRAVLRRFQESRAARI